MARVVWICLCLMLQPWNVIAAASWEFVLEINRFQNPNGQQSNGRKCDRGIASNNKQCDHKFNFCITDDLNYDDYANCPFGSFTRGHYEDTNTNHWDPPIKKNFTANIPYNGYVKLNVKIRDQDPLRSDDVDVIRGVLYSDAASNTWTGWEIIHGSRTNLRLRYKARCLDGCTHSGCDCRDDDHSGHFLCNTNNEFITCREGYMDTNNWCKTSIDDCDPHDGRDDDYPFPHHKCQHDSTCVDRHKDYTCDCEPGWTGRYCEENIDECLSDPCLNGGLCFDQVNGYECACRPGYAPADDCDAHLCDLMNPCDNGGTCNPYDPWCVCPPSYTGEFCETDICDTEPCLNGGHCRQTDDNKGYACFCFNGYLSENCETHICDYPNMCMNGATCVPEVGCVCPPGYAGLTCNEPISSDISDNTYEVLRTTACDDALDNTGDLECVNGVVFDVSTKKCACLPGYVGPDCRTTRCELAGCRNNATCVFDTGHCNCADGFYGAHCEFKEKYMESSLKNSTRSCSPSDDANGHYICNYQNRYVTCLDGWENTEHRCLDSIDDCQPDFEHVPHHKCDHGECVDGHLGYICLCLAGWTSRFCDVNIDECASDPCQNDALCVDCVNHYKCMCRPGFAGTHCENEACDDVPNFCLNGGTCTATLICVCPPGYTGARCETDIDECESNPCQNDARCLDLVNGYFCWCTNHLTQGEHCQYHLCDEQDVCQNGGTCDYNHGCLCAPGYGGMICDYPTREAGDENVEDNNVEKKND